MKVLGSCELYVSACGMIDEVSPTAEAVFGMSTGSLKGQLLLNRFDVASRQRLRMLWQYWSNSTVESTNPCEHELTALRGDASLLPTLATFRVQQPARLAALCCGCSPWLTNLQWGMRSCRSRSTMR